MPKQRYTEANWRKDPQFRALCGALAACRSVEEVASFLRDIGTLSELQAWSERLEVAKQLFQGKTYREVAANTGASTTTVTRVAKFLAAGEGGYKRCFSAGKWSGFPSESGRTARSSVLKGYLERAQE